MNLLLRLLVVLGATATTTSLAAEPPDVKFLYPAGAARGTTVDVTVGGKVGTRPVQAWCGRDGVEVTVHEKESKLSVKVAADATPGVCWIRLFNAEGASSLRPLFVGTLPEVAEKEPNDQLDAAQELPSSRAVVNGRLEKTGDADTFAVPLTAGETLVASMTANEQLGSPMDGVLQILSPRGFVLEQNDDARGLDPHLVLTAPEDGTYFVRAFAFPATPTSAIRLAGGSDFICRLTLTTGPLADHVLPLSLPRGSEATVRVVGWNIPEEMQNLRVAPGDADAVTVSHPDLGNAIVVPTIAHPAVVETEPSHGGREDSAERDAGQEGAAQQGGDQEDAGQPQPITPPVTISGRVDPAGDVDAYTFEAAKGDKLIFDVASRSLGHPLDPVLTLRDSRGEELARVDDPRRGTFDAALNHDFKEDGTYRIEVSDLYGHGGLRYAYRLTVAPPQPEFALSVAADSFTLTAGKPLKVPVTIDRRNGFNGEIELRTEGLPDEVTVEAGVSQPKGKSAKTVELTLTAAEPVAIDKPWRIVGRSERESRTHVQPASAPIAGLDARTRDLWLTVRKP